MSACHKDFLKEVYTDHDKYGSAALPYRLFVPINNDPNRKYPMVIFLHGVGERGSDNERQITFDLTPPVLLIKDEYIEKHPCFILAPQCPNDKKWVEILWELGNYKQDEVPISTPLAMLADLIDVLCGQYNIDQGRIYVTGLSMGGYGTWDLITRFPEKFAAAAPICGGGDPSKMPLVKNLPIWTFHGVLDNVIPVRTTRELVDALKKCGSQSVIYTEYPDLDHFCWNQAYTTEGFFDWMFRQRR